MAHRDDAANREVTLAIDGVPLQLNGFVKDVFQEVVVGLVRSLGDEDPQGRIELLVSAANSRNS